MDHPHGPITLHNAIVQELFFVYAHTRLLGPFLAPLTISDSDVLLSFLLYSIFLIFGGLILFPIFDKRLRELIYGEPNQEYRFTRKDLTNYLLADTLAFIIFLVVVPRVMLYFYPKIFDPVEKARLTFDLGFQEYNQIWIAACYIVVCVRLCYYGFRRIFAD